MRALSCLLAVSLLAGAIPPLSGDDSRSPSRVQDLYSLDQRMRGVCWVAGRRVDESVFLPLVRANVEWISQTPFGWMQRPGSTDIRIASQGDVFWGETDAGLAETTKLARAFGIRTLLKPHLWVAGWHDTVWTGEIRMPSTSAWKAWFESYRRFILHYAVLAEEHHMEALAVGTELQGATLGHEEEWREIIRQIRKVYHGKLTYAANWDHEFETIGFWDALDFAGVQAYFPLSQESDPSLEALLAGWSGPIKMLDGVAGRIGRPIVFTEVGYKSADRASVEPWRWETTDRANPEQQARCYEAMFRAVWGKPWLEGVYVWKWFPRFDTARSDGDNNFTPQGKPAEQVLSRWYAARDVTLSSVPAQP